MQQAVHCCHCHSLMASDAQGSLVQAGSSHPRQSLGTANVLCKRSAGNDDAVGTHMTPDVTVPQTQGCAVSSAPPQKACGRQLHRQTAVNSMPDTRFLHAALYSDAHQEQRAATCEHGCLLETWTWRNAWVPDVNAWHLVPKRSRWGLL